MSDEIKKPQQEGFGYIDDNDESLRSKSGGKFGLNPGVFITKFEYNPNAGKNEELADAIDIHIQVGDREYRSRIYDITDTVYGKSNQQIAKGEEGFIEAYNSDMRQRRAVIIHTAKALGVTDEILKKALTSVPANFVEWAKIVTALPSEESYSRPVDVFLEYQWEIPAGENITYLQVPKNMKGGRFLCPSITTDGEWEAQDDGKGGLVYKDGANKEHPFTRSADFMTSNKAIQQGQTRDGDKNIQKGAVKGKKSTW